MSTNTSYTRALSELDLANHFIDSDSFIEVSKKIGANYVSQKTPISALANTLITTYSLYNNLNDIFNSMEHPIDAYFPTSQVEFKTNPYVHYENNKSFEDLTKDNMLVTMRGLNDYLADVGICVPIHGIDSNYYYYDAETRLWKMDNSKKPTVMSYQQDSIWTIHSNLKFEYLNDDFYATPLVKAPRNIMLDVTGNLFLSKDYEDNFYEQQHWIAGIVIENRLVTFTFLKNILRIDDDVIAQFHFKCPIANDTNFKIITNANVNFFLDNSESDYPRKLYSGINAVNLSYYD